LPLITVEFKSMQNTHTRSIALIASSIAAVVSVAGSAVAADLGPYRSPSRQSSLPPVEYSQPFSWSGLYMGVQLGYAGGNTEASSGPTAGFNQSYDYKSSGWLGGAHAGYNFQRGNLVYGLEADLEKSSQDGNGTGSRGFAHSTALDWQGSVRGRLGLAFDRTLVYGTAGWAFGDVKVDKGFANYSDVRNGWTAGVGVEHMLTQSLSARIEYRYTDFGRADYGNTTINSIDRSSLDQHAVRAGLSLKF
jgi:outer membrane immunogenic protein